MKSRTPTLRGLPVRTFLEHTFEVHGASTVGGRKNQEDSFRASPRLVVVADGMGGETGGKEASETVARTLASSEKKLFEKPGRVGNKLFEAIKEAHAALKQEQAKHPRLSRMGSTVAAAAFDDEGNAHLAHCGDSRIYLLRGNQLLKLTRDHNVAQELRELGEKEEKALLYDHVLTRSLGASEKANPDSQTVQLQHGDRILAVSDGIKTLKEEEIKAVLLAHAGAKEAARELVKKADEAGRAAGGGHDNITAVVANYLLKKK